MAKIPGTAVASPLVPIDSSSTTPTHSARYGKGGLRGVATIAALDDIPVSYREHGMLVFVEALGAYYQCGPGPVFSFGAAPFVPGPSADTIYPNTSSGLAAVGEGGYFYVATSEGLKLYRDIAGAASFVGDFPSLATLSAEVAAAAASVVAAGEAQALAEDARDEATEQAGIATTQAGVSTAQAVFAANQAGEATNQAGIAGGHATQSGIFRDQARAAADATAPQRFFDTYADALAAISTIPDDAVIEVFEDETQDDYRTRYLKEPGNLVLKVRFEADTILTDLANPAAGKGADLVANVTKTFDSVAEMKLQSLEAGRSVETKSYYAGRNQGGGTYEVVSAIDYAAISLSRGGANGGPSELDNGDGLVDHLLPNGNVALLSRLGGSMISATQCGAYGDRDAVDEHDDITALRAFHRYNWKRGWDHVMDPLPYHISEQWAFDNGSRNLRPVSLWAYNATVDHGVTQRSSWPMIIRGLGSVNSPIWGFGFNRAQLSSYFDLVATNSAEAGFKLGVDATSQVSRAKWYGCQALNCGLVAGESGFLLDETLADYVNSVDFFGCDTKGSGRYGWETLGPVNGANWYGGTFENDTLGSCRAGSGTRRWCISGGYYVGAMVDDSTGQGVATGFHNNGTFSGTSAPAFLAHWNGTANSFVFKRAGVTQRGNNELAVTGVGAISGTGPHVVTFDGTLPAPSNSSQGVAKISIGSRGSNADTTRSYLLDVDILISRNSSGGYTIKSTADTEIGCTFTSATIDSVTGEVTVTFESNNAQTVGSLNRSTYARYL